MAALGRQQEWYRRGLFFAFVSYGRQRRFFYWRKTAPGKDHGTDCEAGVRTGFAMTHCKGCGMAGRCGERTRAHRLPIGFRRGGRPCPPGPDNATPCRAGPVCPAVGAVQNRRADVGIGPYGCMQGVWEKNPPVTASPCQPPLGKGAEGTGGCGSPRPVCELASQ